MNATNYWGGVAAFGLVSHMTGTFGINDIFATPSSTLKLIQ